jgi:Undecaprenyl-phosphate glucose phosphotransferase
MQDPEFIADGQIGLRRVKTRDIKLSEWSLGLFCAAGDALIAFFVILVSNVGYNLVVGGSFFVSRDVVAAGLMISILFPALQGVQGAYSLRRYLKTGSSLNLASFSWCSVFFIAAWAAFLMKITSDFSRLSFTLSFIVGLPVILASRLLLIRTMKDSLERHRLVLRRAFLISTSSLDPDAVVRDSLKQGVRMTGVRIVDIDQGIDAFAAACMEAVDDVKAKLHGSALDEVYVLLPWHEKQSLKILRDALSQVPLRVFLLSDRDIAEMLGMRERTFGPLLAFEIQRSPLSTAELFLKRMLDISVASTALLFLLPLLALVVCAMLLESGRPIIFQQRRKGFGGRPFTIYKLRTMTVMENGDCIVQATRNDPRVTRLGAILRRTSVDELPQLWNVIKGDMSIVGPRPHAMAHDTFYDKLISDYAYRHHVKPGLTGWAQINGLRGETQEVQLMADRIRHDRWYIDNWSIWLDLMVILRTAVQVLFQKQAY